MWDIPHRHPQVSLVSKWNRCRPDAIQVGHRVLQRNKRCRERGRDSWLKEPVLQKPGQIARNEERYLEWDV